MVKQKRGSKNRVGRPSISKAGKGGRTPIIGLRLDPEETAALDDLAKKEGLKRSEMVRRLIAAARQIYKPNKM